MEVISAYLPYKLKCKVVDQSIEKIAELSGVYSDGSCVFHDIVESHKGFTEVKPILRPLSDLTITEYWRISGKDKNKNFGFWYGKYNGFSDKREYIYHEGYSSKKFFINEGYDQFPYKMIEFFLKHHFDVFGLIEKGKAIDINTVKEWK